MNKPEIIEQIKADGQEDLRAQCREIMAEEGLSQTAIARESGVAYGTLTAWLGGTYAGRNEKIAAQVSRWLRSRLDRAGVAAAVPMAPSFLMTESAERFVTALRIAQVLPDIAAIVGGAGIGNASFNSNDPPTPPTGANWITLGGGAINVTSPGTHRNGVGIHYKLAQSAAEAVGTLPADFNGSFGGAVFRICPIPANLADIFGTIASDFDASVSDTSFSQPAVDMEGNAGFVLQGAVLGSLGSGAHHILRAELEANKRARTAGATSISVSALVTAWAAGSSTIGAASRKAAVAVPIFRPEDI